ncbi:MAG: hypothetical protein NC819_04380 [Candidatus Omnitrophica bacterium]|nr:hypothetical protein [Candidatus Omnitrophota bacterium]
MGRSRSLRRSTRLGRETAFALLLGLGVGFTIGFLGRPSKEFPLPLCLPSADQRITGIVDIRPELRKELKPTDVLYLIVSREGETVPLAVKKIQPVGFPFLYTVGPEDLMMPGVEFTGSVRVRARVDKDGEANSPQPGDLTGEAAGSIRIPDRNVHILVDTVVPEKKP